MSLDIKKREKKKVRLDGQLLTGYLPVRSERHKTEIHYENRFIFLSGPSDETSEAQTRVKI